MDLEDLLFFTFFLNHRRN